MLFCRRWYIPIQARHSESIQASPGTARFVHLEAAATMFRTPFTDLVSPSAEHEGYRKCHKLSMQLALCKEAYGLSRAAEQCKAEDEDFRECMFGFKQRARVQLMQKERERQFKNGEREQKYAEPATMDGFNMRNPYS